MQQEPAVRTATPLLFPHHLWISDDDFGSWRSIDQLGRLPEATPLVRWGDWANGHGLACSMILMEARPANIFICMNQTSNPVILGDADVTICQSYEENVAQQQHLNRLKINRSFL